MSDHLEHRCYFCGSYLHHADDCPNLKDTQNSRITELEKKLKEVEKERDELKRYNNAIVNFDLVQDRDQLKQDRDSVLEALQHSVDCLIQAAGWLNNKYRILWPIAAQLNDKALAQRILNENKQEKE